MSDLTLHVTWSDDFLFVDKKSVGLWLPWNVLDHKKSTTPCQPYRTNYLEPNSSPSSTWRVLSYIPQRTISGTLPCLQPPITMKAWPHLPEIVVTFSNNVQTTAGFYKSIQNHLFLLFQAVQAPLLPDMIPVPNPDTLLLLWRLPTCGSLSSTVNGSIWISLKLLLVLYK